MPGIEDAQFKQHAAAAKAGCPVSQALAADAWMKEVAPSTELRKWFGHRVERWDEFRRRYRAELDANPAAWEPILEAAKRRTVTLLYSARDTDHNGAVVLRDYLAERMKPRRRSA